jgi:hypothetical protein
VWLEPDVDGVRGPGRGSPLHIIYSIDGLANGLLSVVETRLDCELPTTHGMIHHHELIHRTHTSSTPHLMTSGSSMLSGPADSIVCCHEFVEPGITKPNENSHS